jgi:dihydrofolate reductase
MAKLIYSGITSLDGYIADENGKFDWSAPDDEVHSFINDLDRPVGTYLLGRRMYEVLRVWETVHTQPDLPAYILDFAAIWRGVDKIVYSRTLEAVSTARTRLERDFDADAIRRMKETSPHDLTIGGADLAAHAIRAGLVDEWHLFLNPVVVGGGTPHLPDNVRVDLDLVDEHRFRNGVVFLKYRTRT